MRKGFRPNATSASEATSLRASLSRDFDLASSSPVKKPVVTSSLSLKEELSSRKANTHSIPTMSLTLPVVADVARPGNMSDTVSTTQPTRPNMDATDSVHKSNSHSTPDISLTLPAVADAAGQESVSNTVTTMEPTRADTGAEACVKDRAMAARDLTMNLSEKPLTRAHHAAHEKTDLSSRKRTDLVPHSVIAGTSQANITRGDTIGSFFKLKTRKPTSSALASKTALSVISGSHKVSAKSVPSAQNNRASVIETLQAVKTLLKPNDVASSVSHPVISGTRKVSAPPSVSSPLSELQSTPRTAAAAVSDAQRHYERGHRVPAKNTTPTKSSRFSKDEPVHSEGVPATAELLKSPPPLAGLPDSPPLAKLPTITLLTSPLFEPTPPSENSDLDSQKSASQPLSSNDRSSTQHLSLPQPMNMQKDTLSQQQKSGQPKAGENTSVRASLFGLRSTQKAPSCEDQRRSRILGIRPARPTSAGPAAEPATKRARVKHVAPRPHSATDMSRNGLRDMPLNRAGRGFASSGIGASGKHAGSFASEGKAAQKSSASKDLDHHALSSGMIPWLKRSSRKSSSTISVRGHDSRSRQASDYEAQAGFPNPPGKTPADGTGAASRLRSHTDTSLAGGHENQGRLDAGRTTSSAIAVASSARPANPPRSKSSLGREAHHGISAARGGGSGRYPQPHPPSQVPLASASLSNLAGCNLSHPANASDLFQSLPPTLSQPSSHAGGTKLTHLPDPHALFAATQQNASLAMQLPDVFRDGQHGLHFGKNFQMSGASGNPYLQSQAFHKQHHPTPVFPQPSAREPLNLPAGDAPHTESSKHSSAMHEAALRFMSPHHTQTLDWRLRATTGIYDDPTLPRKQHIEDFAGPIGRGSASRRKLDSSLQVRQGFWK